MRKRKNALRTPRPADRIALVRVASPPVHATGAPVLVSSSLEFSPRPISIRTFCTLMDARAELTGPPCSDASRHALAALRAPLRGRWEGGGEGAETQATRSREAEADDWTAGNRAAGDTHDDARPLCVHTATRGHCVLCAHAGRRSLSATSTHNGAVQRAQPVRNNPRKCSSDPALVIAESWSSSGVTRVLLRYQSLAAAARRTTCLLRR